MFVIMGAYGHVGSAVVDALLEREQEVLAVTHDPRHAFRWQGTGAQVALADVNDPAALRAVFRQGRRAFLLNPPAPVDGDTDATERHSVAQLLEALRDSGLEKVVAESTGGARPGERLGDLNVLWELEQGLQRQPIPAAINRAGFYMSNWDAQLDSVRETGQLVSLFPADLALPMAAPRDLGETAAQRLLSPVDEVGIRDAEGPARYSANDVAQAFAKALERPVQVTVVPREQWVASFLKQGFSQAAADSYARMTGVAMDALDLSANPIRGRITIDEYIQSLVAPVSRAS
ncbi:NmrA family NAD(P)-binding protein [Mitsuaria sp. GD03876]|uniref:NmrA family NAD(P)-binding protein n=1 Tax=Mitsuaria sp. GD03876 TaxID=2975399 RepID=UPI0024474612|nr:NmrA family NAD(P)-binding protein [Mitsuaria sp. GD03876]MDH0865826.1 NmrA family NAD(P)-binding protein [Mitsuaria sp. GD03876]